MPRENRWSGVEAEWRGYPVARVRNRQTDEVVGVYKRLGKWRFYADDEPVRDQALVACARRLLAAMALVGALVALVLPSAVVASPFTPQMEASYRRALTAWGTPGGPPSCATVNREVVPVKTLGAAGRATVPEAPGTECVLLLSDVPFASCQTYEILLHEVGHLLGYGHSRDPDSIMFGGGMGAYYCEYEAMQHLRHRLKRDRRRCGVIKVNLRRWRCLQGAHRERRALYRFEAEMTPRPSLP